MDWLPDGVIAHLRDVIGTPDLTETRYELLSEIGRGGMGIVYLARDPKLGRKVALKVLNALDSAEDAAARMANEARVLALLEHPGIVPVHDAGVLPDGRAYYVMKRVEGMRLDEYAAKHVPLPELLRVFSRICEPVAFAHSQGVIHRDLKPENIMVGTFGEVLVLDWGVAKVIGALSLAGSGGAAFSQGLTQDGAVIGTREYMPPEQASGAIHQVDARSDVYSLGKILQYLLTTADRASPRPARPKPIAAIAGKASSAEPSQRYASALDLAAEVVRFLDGEPVSAYRESLLERAGRVIAHNKTLAGLLAAYVLARIMIFLFARR